MKKDTKETQVGHKIQNNFKDEISNTNRWKNNHKEIKMHLKETEND